MILQGYIYSILYGVFCLAIALVAYKLGMPKKYTRKLVHILVGFEWFILYTFMGAGVHFLIVCLFFLGLLSLAYLKNLMPMISSDSDNAPGTVYYAVAMTGVAIVGCFCPTVMLPFGIAIMCTSLGDGAAGLFGQLIKRYNPRIYKNKTLFGSIANFVMSFLGALALSELYDGGLTIPEMLAIALLSASLELIVGYGLDNIVITWAVTAFTFGLMFYDAISFFIFPILATPLVIAFVTAKRALTPWGTLGAIIMDVVVSLAFGNFGFTILIAFFAGSILVDKIKKRNKNLGREETAKGEHRDLVQVIANGLVPFAMAVAFIFSHSNKLFLIGFVASLAEAFSDTAASGIGSYSRHTFDLFRWRKCENRLSGGMSVIGTVSSLLAAFLIAALTRLVGGRAISLGDFLIIGTAAFLGSIFDSFLGSLFQVKYRCKTCGTLTERTVHCDAPAERESGFTFVDNDLVNLSSGFFSAVIAIAARIIL